MKSTFGDDVIGQAPVDGNIVIANYRICNGTMVMVLVRLQAHQHLVDILHLQLL
jgi:hypothetical protein